MDTNNCDLGFTDVCSVLALGINCQEMMEPALFGDALAKNLVCTKDVRNIVLNYKNLQMKATIEGWL